MRVEGKRCDERVYIGKFLLRVYVRLVVVLDVCKCESEHTTRTHTKRAYRR